MRRPYWPVPRREPPLVKSRIIRPPKIVAVVILPVQRAIKVVAVDLKQRYLGSRFTVGFLQKPAIKIVRAIQAISLPQKYLGSRFVVGFLQKPAIKVLRAVQAISLPQKYLPSRQFLPKVISVVVILPVQRAIRAFVARDLVPAKSRINAVKVASAVVAGVPFIILKMGGGVYIEIDGKIKFKI